MFAQFRIQYPQGSIKTEMMPKVDGLHVFRATVGHGDLVLGTGTAADPDLEIAEDRAVKRALTISGINFDSYSMQATLMPQQKINNHLVLQSNPQNNPESLPSSSPTFPQSIEQLDLSNLSPDYQSEYSSSYDSGYEPDYESESNSIIDRAPEPSIPSATTKTASKVEVPAEISSEPIDLSDVLAQTQVEMARLGWDVAQGREYLQRNFKKRSRQELSTSEITQFLSYLKSQPTPQNL